MWKTDQHLESGNVINSLEYNTLIQIISAMRPRQWFKNTLVFAAMIFAQELFQPYSLSMSILAFLLFCLLSGCVYIINDAFDRKEDQQHPYKKHRPIASGQLKISLALGTAIPLAISSLVASFLLNFKFGIITTIYIGINLAYSRYLKHVVIIDVMVIALGFVLRAVGGAVIIDVNISHWLIICTTLLSLFLGFGKRRHELVIMKDSAGNHRPILSEYSPYFLDQLIGVMTASIVVTYALYTMSDEVIDKLGTSHLNLTIPFVLYGVFRYLYLVHQKNKGGDPTFVLYTDKPLLVNVGLWMIAVCIILYV